MLLATADIKPGSRLGKYEILEKLAVGGMAEIYLGRVEGTAGFAKLVAIKRILPSVASDRGFVQMFLAEARLAATLSHPNIADVFDVGEDAGSYFFAMELIHGQDVRNIRIAAHDIERKIPLAISLAIAKATAYALAYAHAKVDRNGRSLQLVHRDISPSNILVSYDGAVKLVDFGIARAERGSSLAQTQTNALRGKVPYMSPEQCRARTIDRRSDLFSLGTVIYELTTDTRPFDGVSEFDTLEQIVYGRCRAPSEIDRSYPRKLETIVMRLLAADPAARYQSAEDLLIDLERFVMDAGLFASDNAVATYMRDLFAEDIAEHEQRTRNSLEMATVAYPVVPPPHVASELATREHDFSADGGTVPDAPEFHDESTVKIKVEHVGRSTHTEVEPRHVRRPAHTESEALPIVKQPVEVAPPREQIDLVDASVAAIGASLVSTEPLDRVTELLDRADGWHNLDQDTKAVIAVELALNEEPRGVEIDEVLLEHFGLIRAIYVAFIGDPKRMPVLSQHLDEVELRIDQRAAFLLSRIDGTLSVDELFAISGMPSMQAYRHLCHLVLRGIVVLV